jgi:glutamate synthase domain-containing protein 1
MQLPDTFFRKECAKSGIALPAFLEYGVGMIFLPSDKKERELCEKKFEEIVKEEGQKFLGWRTVPVDSSPLGETALACMPYIRQAFIQKSPQIPDDAAFERSST